MVSAQVGGCSSKSSAVSLGLSQHHERVAAISVCLVNTFPWCLAEPALSLLTQSKLISHVCHASSLLHDIHVSLFFCEVYTQACCLPYRGPGGETTAQWSQGCKKGDCRH